MRELDGSDDFEGSCLWVLGGCYVFAVDFDDGPALIAVGLGLAFEHRVFGDVDSGEEAVAVPVVVVAIIVYSLMRMKNSPSARTASNPQYPLGQPLHLSNY